MTKVDLSPDCVNALIEMQGNSNSFAGMIDFACDFIIEHTSVCGDDSVSGTAMAVLLNLRCIRKVILKFEEEEKED